MLLCVMYLLLLSPVAAYSNWESTKLDAPPPPPPAVHSRTINFCLSEIRASFAALDTNGDGVLSKAEVGDVGLASAVRPTISLTPGAASGVINATSSGVLPLLHLRGASAPTAAAPTAAAGATLAGPTFPTAAASAPFTANASALASSAATAAAAGTTPTTSASTTASAANASNTVMGATPTAPASPAIALASSIAPVAPADAVVAGAALIASATATEAAGVSTTGAAYNLPPPPPPPSPEASPPPPPPPSPEASLPPPPAAAAATTRDVLITVPAGVVSGQQLLVTSPFGGAQLRITVPAGAPSRPRPPHPAH